MRYIYKVMIHYSYNKNKIFKFHIIIHESRGIY